MDIESDIYENNVWMHNEIEKLNRIKNYVNHSIHLELDEETGFIIDKSSGKYLMIEEFFINNKDKI